MARNQPHKNKLKKSTEDDYDFFDKADYCGLNYLEKSKPRNRLTLNSDIKTNKVDLKNSKNPEVMQFGNSSLNKNKKHNSESELVIKLDVNTY